MTNASVLRARKASLLGAFVVATLVSSQMAALSIAAPATGAVAPADNNDLMTDNGKGGDPALYLAAAQLQDKSTNASAGGTSSSGDPQQVIQPGDPTDSADPAPDGPGATPNVVFGPDERRRVSNTTLYPWRAIASISTSLGGCTGSMVAPTILITAAHCLYDTKTNHWGNNFIMYPGRNASSIPYGSCRAQALYAPYGWTFGHYQSYDWGIAKLNCTIGNTVGWFGYDGSGSASGFIAGYPGEKSPSKSMWTESGSWAAQPAIMTYTIDTTGGQSGAALVKSGCGTYCAVAVHDGGNGSTNVASRIITGNGAIQAINALR